MAHGKTLFAPVPLRAMAADLSGLELRVLICVTAHDRLSLVTGKGQGCRASNDRMTAMVGCNYSRLCSTLTALEGRGFLKKEKLGRHTVYRAIYTDADRLLFGNVSIRSIGCRTESAAGAIGCRQFAETRGNLPETGSQYIPLNGGIDSDETGEDNSVETARLTSRGLSRMEREPSVGETLARFERAFNAGAINAGDETLQWLAYLERIQEDELGTSESGRAQRLHEEVGGSLSDAEWERWQAHNPAFGPPSVEESPAPKFDLAATIRAQVAPHWRSLKPLERAALARSIKVGDGELGRFIAGTADLSVPKLMALRSAAREVA